MAACKDLDSVMASVCSTSRNGDVTDYVQLLKVVEQLRQLLLKADDQPGPVPPVLDNEVVFKSVFCFVLDRRRGVRYLEELGRTGVAGWSELVELEPLEFVQKMRTQSASADDRAAVIVMFLWSALKLATTVTETLDIAREERVRTSKKAWDAGDEKDPVSDVQQGLNKALISCVHLGKLMQSRRPEDRAIYAEETRQMFAGFSIVAQLVHDHGDFKVLEEMMSLSEVAFQLTHGVLETVVDIRSDVSQRFLPQIIKTLISTDPELSYSIPFRMYWYFIHVQMVKKATGGEEWRVHQHLSNANHYCADEAANYYDGRYTFICWLLYGLSLFDCGEYASAKVVLTMNHLRTAADQLPPCRTAADCILKCSEQEAKQGVTVPIDFLLYFGTVIGGADNYLSQPETTVWHSIYDDPAVRKYSPRHIPDYVDICRRLMESDQSAPRDTVPSLVLESVGPLIDLAYQPKKPTKVIRSDNSVNIYGGSVNENLDIQSHIDAAKEEVPDIDMMMAVSPSQIGIDAELDSSSTTPRYAYLRNPTTGDRFPSFELLEDSLPIGLNKVAEFVAEPAFAAEYEILSIAIHGPAIATKIRRGSDVLSYDHVPAFWLKTWPKVAEEWKTRQRRYGWPSASDIETIVEDGVLVVAACHPNSSDPHNEWRVSFTIAERLLVDSLSSVQRLAYLYAKLIWMSSLKSSSFLVSYHLKNALLWLCEERPAEFWAGDNLVVCVGDIFRWLQQEIGVGRLRNYFIADDSMIPTWVKSTEELLQSLQHISNNVFQYIVDADAKLRHIALLNELRIGDLAEKVKCRPLSSAAESLISHLRSFIANLGDDLLDNRQPLLDSLDKAQRSLEHHH